MLTKARHSASVMAMKCQIVYSSPEGARVCHFLTELSNVLVLGPQPDGKVTNVLSVYISKLPSPGMFSPSSCETNRK